MIELHQVKKYLEEISEIKKSFRFYDCHVHPYDIFNQIDNYRQNPYNKKIYSLNDSEFRIPELSGIKTAEETKDEKSIKSLKTEFVKSIMLLQAKKQYCHIGLPVLSGFMNLCSIDESLLLPVPYKGENFNDQMMRMENNYGKNSRFKLSGSVPNEILNEDIHKYIKELRDRFSITAIKIHPIIMGIDLSSAFGKERLENILIACNEFKLALLIHGGSSLLYADCPEITYSEIENLEQIDWNLSKSKVVIAHAACYDSELSRVENIILPKLKKILEKYNNLLVDLSALGYQTLYVALKTIDTDRIIFGSDALYFSQWSGIVKMYDILKKVFSDYNHYFLKIISKNPEQTVFNKQMQI